MIIKFNFNVEVVKHDFNFTELVAVPKPFDVQYITETYIERLLVIY